MRFFDQVQHLDAEGAHRALQLAEVGYHIGGFAGVDHGDRDDARIHGFLVAADDVLEALHHLAGHRHRVCAEVRHRGVAALAAYGDLELVARGHHRPRADGEVPTAAPGQLCMPKTASHGEFFEEAVLDHLARPAAAFFGRLEDQVDRAVEVAVLREMARRGQQHGGMAVMAAGVHLARLRAGMGEFVELLHGQRVHVGTQADGPAAGAAVAAVHDAHHAGGAHAAVNRDAPGFEFLRDHVGGAHFLEAQFRVGVDVAAHGRDVGRPGEDGFNDFHGDVP